jgi:hypothetical protein
MQPILQTKRSINADEGKDKIKENLKTNAFSKEKVAIG